MNAIDLLTNTMAIAVGVFAALILCCYVTWPKIENLVFRLNNLNAKKDLHKEKLQLKVAAYERLLLFVHRITPYQVMVRQHNSSLSLDQFKSAVVNDIEQEFQHNFTQQLYVSDAAWTVVKDLKSSTISLLNNVKKGLHQEASTEEFIALVLKHVSDLEVNPYEAAQIILKKQLSSQ